MTRTLCRIRKPFIWHSDLVPFALLKVHSDDNSEHLSCNDSKTPDDDTEMSIDD